MNSFAESSPISIFGCLRQYWHSVRFCYCSSRGHERSPSATVGGVSGFAAGAWLGAAEAPTKLVSAGFSPFLISLGMVTGVFVARWTLPTALKGTRFVLLDIRERPHLIVMGHSRGCTLGGANTLTVFAIRDVGLSVAFPLWNTNSLIGLLCASGSVHDPTVLAETKGTPEVHSKHEAVN